MSLVEKAGGEMLVTAARRSMRRYRDDLEEIVEYAVERGWLVEHSAPSYTDQPKRILKTVPRYPWARRGQVDSPLLAVRAPKLADSK